MSLTPEEILDQIDQAMLNFLKAIESATGKKAIVAWAIDQSGPDHPEMTCCSSICSENISARELDRIMLSLISAVINPPEGEYPYDNPWKDQMDG